MTPEDMTPEEELRAFAEWVRDVDPTTTTLSRVKKWAAEALLATYALQSESGRPPARGIDNWRQIRDGVSMGSQPDDAAQATPPSKKASA